MPDGFAVLVRKGDKIHFEGIFDTPHLEDAPGVCRNRALIHEELGAPDLDIVQVPARLRRWCFFARGRLIGAVAEGKQDRFAGVRAQFVRFVQPLGSSRRAADTGEAGQRIQNLRHSCLGAGFGRAGNRQRREGGAIVGADLDNAVVEVLLDVVERIKRQRLIAAGDCNLEDQEIVGKIGVAGVEHLVSDGPARRDSDIIYIDDAPLRPNVGIAVKGDGRLGVDRR